MQDDLKQEINKGESKTLELKSELPQQSEKYIKTLVAFANTAGGKLIVGVRNKDKAVLGVSNAAVAADRIATTLSQMCVPLLTPNIYRETVDGKDLVIAEIYPGATTPYYIKSQGIEKGTYVKVGGTTELADDAQIRELQLRGASQSYDAQIYVGQPYDEKAAHALCKVIDEYRRQSAEAKGNDAPAQKVTPTNLENWGLLRRFESKLLPSRAFMLLTENPFEFAKIQCAQFKGTDRVVFLDRREYSGPLYEQIEEAVQFVLRNIRFGAEISGLLREDSYELPIVAIREAIINATIHRSLQLTSAVQVALYDDRLEVSSPGALFGSLTLEQALAGSTALRNPKVAKVFEEMDLFESWGTGLRRIRESCKKLGLPEPEFLEIGDMFRVNLFRAGLGSSDLKPAVKPAVKTAVKNFQGKPAEAQMEIMRLLTGNPSLTGVDLADKLGVSVRTVQVHLATLKLEGLLEYVGSARTGHWVINR